MFLYTLVSEYDIFPSAPQNSTAFPIDNGVIYRTDGNFSGIFSTDPFDYLNISNFQNGGFFGGNNQQKEIYKTENCAVFTKTGAAKI